MLREANHTRFQLEEAMFERLVQGRVSIIVPVYNAEDTIVTCLESMRGQTYDNLEVLVVDDCSEDNSVEAMQDWLADVNDPRFRLFQTSENAGPYVIKNLLFVDHITGEFTTCQDADDYSDLERVGKQVTYLQDTPHAGGVGVWLREIVSDPDELPEHWRKRNYKLNGDGYFERFANYPLLIEKKPGHQGQKHFTVCASLLAPTSHFFNLGGFDGTVRFAADSEFVNRLVRIISVGNIPEYLYIRLVHLDSLTTSPDTGMLSQARKDYWALQKKAIERTGLHYQEHGELPNLYKGFVVPNGTTLREIV